MKNLRTIEYYLIVSKRINDAILIIKIAKELGANIPYTVYLDMISPGITMMVLILGQVGETNGQTWPSAQPSTTGINTELPSRTSTHTQSRTNTRTPSTTHSISESPTSSCTSTPSTTSTRTLSKTPSATGSPTSTLSATSSSTISIPVTPIPLNGGPRLSLLWVLIIALGAFVLLCCGFGSYMLYRKWKSGGARGKKGSYQLIIDREPKSNERRRAPKTITKIAEEIEGTVEDISIANTSDIECFRFARRDTEVNFTLFYIPGTASIAHHPPATKAECSNLAKNLNCTVIQITHRLSKQNKYPIPLNDISRVINHYLTHAEQYGIDVSRVGLGGYSSGGFLTLQICLANLATAVLPFKHILLVAPVVSLKDIERNYNDDADFVTKEFFHSMVSAYVPDDMDPALPPFSPIHQEAEQFCGFPSITIAYGSRECFVPEVKALYKKLDSQGIQVRLHEIKDAQHNFPWQEEYADYANDINEQILSHYTLDIDRNEVTSLLKTYLYPEIVVYGQVPKLPLQFSPKISYQIKCVSDYLHGSARETSVVLLCENNQQIALHYFHLYYSNYQVRWWFNARSYKVRSDEMYCNEALNMQFKMLAIKLNLASEETPAGSCISLVHNWVTNRMDPLAVLMVFEDAENEAELLPYCIAHEDTLVTSQNHSWEIFTLWGGNDTNVPLSILQDELSLDINTQELPLSDKKNDVFSARLIPRFSSIFSAGEASSSSPKDDYIIPLDNVCGTVIEEIQESYENDNIKKDFTLQ